MRYQFDLFDMSLLTFIAEGRTLTCAAERANISLPAVSARIHNIEEGLGVKLLHRTRQGVTLTEPGLTFLRHARTMLDQLERLRDDMREFSEGTRGSLKICATTTAVTEFLPAVLGVYLTSNPDIRVDVSENRGGDIVSAVRDGSVDIGIISNTVHSEGLDVFPYRTLRLVLVTGMAHPLAARESVRFDETLAYDYVGLPDASSFQHFLVEASTSLNKRLSLRVRVNNFEAACRMAELNIGVSVLPESVARRNAEAMKIKVIPLADTWALRQLMICVRNKESLPPFAREFTKLLTEDQNGGGASPLMAGSSATASPV